MQDGAVRPDGVVGCRDRADRVRLGRGAAARGAAASSGSSGPTASCGARRSATSTCCRWSSTRRSGRGRTGTDSRRRRRSRSDYVTYLAALVERYGPEGTFWTDHPELPKHPLREWQIWNEPHLPAYWDAPENGPYGYARAYPLLLRASYNIVKSLDPGAKIVMAGLTQRAWEEIEVLYQRGIKRYFDVAALQIFPQTIRRSVKATALFRDAEAPRRRAQADLPDGDHLARLEGEDPGHQVPAPGDRARDGDQAEPGVRRDGRAPARLGVARCSGTRGPRPTAAAAASSTTPGYSATTTAGSRLSRRWAPTSGALAATRAAPRRSRASASSAAAARARGRRPRRCAAR